MNGQPRVVSTYSVEPLVFFLKCQTFLSEKKTNSLNNRFNVVTNESFHFHGNEETERERERKRKNNIQSKSAQYIL